MLLAAAIGLVWPAPLAWLARYEGINVLLAILVFATALTVEPAALRRLGESWRPLVACAVTGITLLPALSWAASRLVAKGSLREGVMAIGLAPCEIASVATTAMAGAATALAAGILVSSTLATITLAGPILSLEAGHADIHPGHIAANLALVVALPLAAGLILRGLRPLGPKVEAAATTAATRGRRTRRSHRRRSPPFESISRSAGGSDPLPPQLCSPRMVPRAPPPPARRSRGAPHHVHARLRYRRLARRHRLRTRRRRSPRRVRHPGPYLGHRRCRHHAPPHSPDGSEHPQWITPTNAFGPCIFQQGGIEQPRAVRPAREEDRRRSTEPSATILSQAVTA